MSTEYLLKAQVKARSGESAEFSVRVIQWTPKERTQRAVKIVAIGLSLSFIFIFLPIVHFVLLPLALILTPIIAWYTYRQVEEIPAQNLGCPHCGASAQMPSQTQFTKQEVLCDSCRTVLEITKIV